MAKKIIIMNNEIQDVNAILYNTKQWYWKYFGTK